MSSSQLKKNNIAELSLIFKEKILLNPYRVEDLKKLAIDAKLSKEKLRPIAWKIFLGVLPNTTSLKEWVEIISNQREEYKKKLKKYCKIKKFVGDPLGGGKKKKKNEVTLKTFYKEDGYIRLQPENDTMDPFIFPNITILGKAIGLYRKL